ncbi:Trm112 family protein [Armatimonas sp.]|uniref:Trm112 family protein n=1 Tax=Armatimonas sp. TaxID=1872638 RepID=UPI0037516AE8
MIASPELLALLRCPVCASKSPLSLEADGSGLYCTSGHHFPLTQGFADLRPEDLKEPAPAAQGK